jgi:hypothetical protein
MLVLISISTFQYHSLLEPYQCEDWERRVMAADDADLGAWSSVHVMKCHLKIRIVTSSRHAICTHSTGNNFHSTLHVLLIKRCNYCCVRSVQSWKAYYHLRSSTEINIIVYTACELGFLSIIRQQMSLINEEKLHNLSYLQVLWLYCLLPVDSNHTNRTMHNVLWCIYTDALSLTA